MDFVDVFYLYLAPLMLLGCLFSPLPYRIYCKRLLTGANVGLIFFFVASCRQYYNLYQMAKAFGLNMNPSSLLQLFSTNIPYTIKSILVCLLPLLFLFRRMASSLFLSALMILLLWWDVADALLLHKGFIMPGTGDDISLANFLQYFSLLVGMFGLLWLITPRWRKA